MSDQGSQKEAGRELDALIAEKVMGLDLTECAVDDGEGWCERCGQEMPYYGRLRARQDGREYRPPRCGGREYSTDISAAWEVLARMQDQIFSKRRAFYTELALLCSEGGYRMAWPDALGTFHAKMPELICRAALAAAPTLGEKP